MILRPSPTAVSLGRSFGSLGLLACLALTGCTSIRQTHPEQTATHQALVSYAAMDSIELIELPELAGQAVYVDDTHLDAYQQAFVLGQFRKRLMLMNVELVDSEEEAQIVIELRSAMLSTNKKDLILGIPAWNVPVPSVGTVETPELALLKQRKQEGVAGLAVLGYDGKTRRFLFASDPVVGLTRMDDWSVIGLPVYSQRLNLPEEINEQ